MASWTRLIITVFIRLQPYAQCRLRPPPHAAHLQSGGDDARRRGRADVVDAEVVALCAAPAGRPSLPRGGLGPRYPRHTFARHSAAFLSLRQLAACRTITIGLVCCEREARALARAGAGAAYASIPARRPRSSCRRRAESTCARHATPRHATPRHATPRHSVKEQPP